MSQLVTFLTILSTGMLTLIQSEADDLMEIDPYSLFRKLSVFIYFKYIRESWLIYLKMKNLTTLLMNSPSVPPVQTLGTSCPTVRFVLDPPREGNG